MKQLGVSVNSSDSVNRRSVESVGQRLFFTEKRIMDLAQKPRFHGIGVGCFFLTKLNVCLLRHEAANPKNYAKIQFAENYSYSDYERRLKIETRFKGKMFFIGGVISKNVLRHP